MALALRSERRDAAGGEAELERLLAEGRRFSAEFPDFLANHLPMVLVAMHRLGGSDKRLGEFFATYRDAHRLQRPEPAAAFILLEVARAEREHVVEVAPRDDEAPVHEQFAGGERRVHQKLALGGAVRELDAEQRPRPVAENPLRPVRGLDFEIAGADQFPQ